VTKGVWAVESRIGIPLVVAIFVTILAVAYSPASNASQVTVKSHDPRIPPATKVEVFNPFTRAGLGSRIKVVAVKRTLTPCQSGGVAGGSSFRCFTNPDIYDPCFARPGAATGPVYCPVDLLHSDVVEIRIGTGRLPSLPTGEVAHQPWAMELTDRKVCVLDNAAWGGLGPFACIPPSGAVADCRIPTSNEGRWTTLCQKSEHHESPFSQYQVVTIWK
jgi:hypothetical protein